MNNPKFNTKFIFAVLVHSTGNIAFFPNSTTFGEIVECYKDQQVTYMPHFQLEETDVLYYEDPGVLCYEDTDVFYCEETDTLSYEETDVRYCEGETFTSFESLFNTYGEEALHHTFIYNDQPK